MFAHHHYLSAEIPPIVDCYLATWDDVVIGFCCVICLPGKSPPLYEGDERIKYRGCRTVILPDFQGLGLGVRLSDAVGDIYIEKGHRYFSKTAHMRMGEYRQKSDKWRATATNLVDRSRSSGSKRDYRKNMHFNHIPLETERICYSHEYIGENRKSYDPKWQKLTQDTQEAFNF